MRIKYGFKKEWMHFSRTFRIWGLIAAVLGFAFADPILYKIIQVMMGMMENYDYSSVFGALTTVGFNPDSYSEIFSDMSSMLNDAGMVFSVTMAEFCGTSLFIMMLLLMSPFGGEQKKKATVIPLCSGLDYFSYIVPKFILYPAAVFVTVFLSAIIAGGLCNILFNHGTVGFGMMILAAFMCALFITFLMSVYMGVGLCTGRPGISTVLVYIGINIVQLILNSLELTEFNPFTLYSLIGGMMFSEGFDLSGHIASIIVGCVLCVIVGVLMFVLSYAVLNAKRINNKEDKPEF